MAKALDDLRLAPKPEAARAVRFSYSRAEQSRLNRTLIRLIERANGQPRLERLYRDWAQKPAAN